MSLPQFDRRILAACAALVLAVACDASSILGPPDGASCTRGTIEVGQVHEGEVDGESCLLWNDYQDLSTPAESWTLRTEANTGYIVRLRPVPDGDDVNNFNGELVLYGRNSANDPVYETGYWDTFGAANTNSGFAQELIFSSTSTGQVSIRAQTYSTADVGAYTIEVIACPMITVAPTTTSAPVEFDAGSDCKLLSDGGQAETPVAFFNFLVAGANATGTVTATRTAGTSNMYFGIRGPDRDFGCYTDLCTANGSATGAGPLALAFNMQLAGSYTVLLYQQTAGTLTATVGLSAVTIP